jgi:hypothetical protein
MTKHIELSVSKLYIEVIGISRCYQKRKEKRHCVSGIQLVNIKIVTSNYSTPRLCAIIPILPIPAKHVPYLTFIDDHQHLLAS